jgi:hypothetical protein
MSAATWQTEVLRAANTWAAAAGVDVSVVKDEGKPFGGAGPLQGSPWYGDIRVAARPLDPSRLAVATPFDMLDAGAGDVVFNAAAAFSAGGGAGTYDLYTVALQEVGHALGLPNSADPASVMYTRYAGPRAGLSAGDVVAARAVYAARSPDRFEGKDGNNAPDRATALRFVSDADQFRRADPTAGPTPWAAAADVTTPGDVDHYRVTVPRGSNDFFVQLRTAGVSSLVARVSVYTERGVLVRSAAAADPRGGDLSLFVGGVRAGASFVIKVEAADPARFAVGGYRLAVGHEAHEAVFPPAVGGWLDPDGGTNDAPVKSKDVGEVKLDGGERWEWSTRASIETAGDRDFYRFKTAKDVSATAAVLIVWALDAEKLDPVVRIYDAAGSPLPADVLGNDRSTYAVQGVGLRPDTTYFVEVAAADPQGSYKEGNYFLGVDLRAAPVVLTTAAAGTLTAAAPQQAFRFDVAAPRTFHFNLGAGQAAGEAVVRATIYDADNRAVASFVVRAGDTVGTDVPLAAGTYTLKLSAGDRSGPLAGVSYRLRWLVRDDPIGPAADDPTAGPTGPTAPPPLLPLVPLTWAYWLDDYSDPWSGV